MSDKYFLRSHEEDRDGKATSWAVCFRDGEMVFEVEHSVYYVADHGYFTSQHMARMHADRLNAEESDAC